AIDKAAAAAKDKISQDPTITSAEKAKQSQAVDDAQAKAKDAVDQAKNADEINQAQADGITGINSIPKSNGTVDEQKKAATDAIDKAAAAAKDKISQDPTITSAEKAKQSQAVDDAQAKAKDAVDQAKNADEINQAQADGITGINSIPKSNGTVDEQKKAATDAIDKAAGAAKDAINKDSSLTDAEKAAGNKAVDAAAAKAKEEINKAVNSDDINKAKENGLAEIGKAVPNSTLDKQKEDAKKSIDDAAAKAKDAINKDPKLTDEQKKAATDAIDKAASAAKDAVDQAKTPDEVNQAKENGLAEIGKVVPDSSLNKQKEDAKKEVDDAAAKAKDKIDKDPNLTDKQKEDAKKQVDDAAAKAKDEIDKAKTPDEVNKAKDKGTSDIDKQVPGNNTPGNSLEDQKKAAKDAIDKAASAAKDAINKDPKLTDEQKKAATDAIDKAASAAKDAVDKAKTPDEVNQAKENGLAEIGKVVPDSSLNKQKEDAKKEVDDAAAKAKDKIDKDSNLTDKQKEDAKKQVDDAAAKAKVEIDKAKTPDEVNKAKDKGTSDIDKQVPGNNNSGGNGNGGNTNPGNTNLTFDKILEDQKKAADKAIDDAVSAAKDKINKDPNLTDEQKAAANKAVDNAAAKAKDAISKAKTPEELKQILDNAIAEINKNIPSQGNNKPDAIEKRLNHNAYFYNKQGKRANLLVAKSGSIISTYGIEKINGREFYITDNGLYVAVNNVISNKRRLKRNAFVYNRYGKRVGITLLKKNSEVGTYGDPVKIKGIAYYIIGQNRYVKAANFAFVTVEANNTLADGVTANAEVHHNAYIYDENGNRLNKLVLKAGSRITTGESRTISGQKYVAIAGGQYLASDNVTGTGRKLKHKSYVYNQYGQRISRKALKKNSAIQTYGNAVNIQGSEYYAVGQNKFVKRSNFK
ncbi:DUF1542 domain-containing protein, partial [Lactobacillus sp. ESL0234]|uniref:DUF1542 domain-containing protein n=1 Tax=Lactobacillus sp. ESL0234 TaxID=2069355 RepID=UPI000EFC4090